MEVSGYSAEYGKMAGGILNMVLKSGANAYHGTAFEYFRNDFFDAKAYFDPYQAGVSPEPIWRRHQRTDQHSETLQRPRPDHSSCSVGKASSIRMAQTYLGVVPTAAEHAGDFAGDASTAGAAHHP